MDVAWQTSTPQNFHAVATFSCNSMAGQPSAGLQYPTPSFTSYLPHARAMTPTAQYPTPMIAQPRYPTSQYPSGCSSSLVSSARKVPDPANLFPRSASLGAEPTKSQKPGHDPLEHVGELQRGMIRFFAVGQRLPLRTFCDANGYESKRKSITRRIQKIPILKNIQETQSMTEGFSQQQSDTAITSIHKEFFASPNAP